MTILVSVDADDGVSHHRVVVDVEVQVDDEVAAKLEEEEEEGQAEHQAYHQSALWLDGFAFIVQDHFLKKNILYTLSKNTANSFFYVQGVHF